MSDETGINLHDTMDAQIWTAEFMRTYTENNFQNLSDVELEGVMLGWFANAIMAGHDGASRTQDRLSIYELDVAISGLTVVRKTMANAIDRKSKS